MANNYSIGAMNQLGDALAKVGLTASDVDKLRQFGDLKTVKDLLSGVAVVSYPGLVIDLDSPPAIPKDEVYFWQVNCHSQGGKICFSPALIKLDKVTISGTRMINPDIYKGCNANLLDFLLEHQGMIPDRWEGFRICFPGTVYENKKGVTSVRVLIWGPKRWSSYYELTGCLYDENLVYAHF